MLKIELSEKWRPKVLEDFVGQPEIINAIKMRDKPKHYLFIGPPGTGKTTLAHILAIRYGIPILEFNASDDRGIGFIRDEIKRQTKIRGEKIILLDEADNLTKEGQGALRRIMENPLSEAHFILTGNEGWKIIEPIKSRCTNFDFKRLKDEDLLSRIIYICQQEEIEITPECQEGLIELLKQVNGDLRKAINTIEKVINKEGKITREIVMSFVKPKTSSEALDIALSGDFEKAKQLIEDTFIENRNSPLQIIKEFYEKIDDIQKPEWKILLYRELANTERALQTENDPILPLIQLIGFIAYAWILPHFPDSLKVL